MVRVPAPATLAAAILAVALGVFSYPHGVLAQEEQEPGPTIYEGPVGPYAMVIQIIPSPPTQGLLNLNATVQEPGTGEYVHDADVLVFVQRQESAERDRRRLFNSPDAPATYRTQLRLLEEGAWIFTFEVSGPLGEGSVEKVVDVQKQPLSIAGWLAWGGMALALLLVLGLAWRNAKRMRRARGS